SAQSTTCFYPLSLHDALPIFRRFYRETLARTNIERNASPTEIINKYFSSKVCFRSRCSIHGLFFTIARKLLITELPCFILATNRSEEHTSELQSRENLVCRLL